MNAQGLDELLDYFGFKKCKHCKHEDDDAECTRCYNCLHHMGFKDNFVIKNDIKQEIKELIKRIK